MSVNTLIDPSNPPIPPGIVKTEEFRMMCKLIDKGLWRSGNLERALGIDKETVAIWKRTETIQRLYSQTVLKFLSKRKDEEKILSELEVESDPTQLEHKVFVIPLLGGATAHAIPSNTGNPQVIEAIEEN